MRPTLELLKNAGIKVCDSESLLMAVVSSIPILLIVSYMYNGKMV